MNSVFQSILELHQTPSVARAALHVELLLFTLVAGVCLSQSLASSSRLPWRGVRSRQSLMLFLFFTLTVRVFALLIYLGYSTCDFSPVPPQRRWIFFCLTSLPAALLVAASSLITDFWIRIRKTSVLQDLTGVGKVLLLSNLTYLMCCVVSAGVTYRWKLYTQYEVLASGLLAVGNLTAGCLFGYHGIRVAVQMLRSRRTSRTRRVVRRVIMLALTWPVLLGLRSAWSLAFIFKYIPDYYPAAVVPALWDAEVMFVGEWVPAVLLVVGFWPTHDQETDSRTLLDTPLLRGGAVIGYRPSPTPNGPTGLTDLDTSGARWSVAQNSRS